MNGSRVLNPVAANEIAKHGVFLGAATHFMRFARAFVLRLERTESARMDVHWWRNEMTHQKPAGVSKTPVFKKPVLFLEETSDFLGSARILSISVPPPCPPPTKDSKLFARCVVYANPWLGGAGGRHADQKDAACLCFGMQYFETCRFPFVL